MYLEPLKIEERIRFLKGKNRNKKTFLVPTLPPSSEASGHGTRALVVRTGLLAIIAVRQRCYSNGALTRPSNECTRSESGGGLSNRAEGRAASSAAQDANF